MMTDIPAALIPILFLGIVCGAYTLPFIAVAVARIIRAGNRHLDR